MIAEDYVSYEVAKLLKEKGFPFIEHLFMYVDKSGRFMTDHQACLTLSVEEYCKHFDELFTPTITHQMAMKWLREVYKVLIVIDAYHADHWEGYIDAFEISIYSHASTIIVPNEIAYHTNYEEAVDATLKYCLTELI